MLEQKRIRSHNTAARKENKGDGQGPKKRCAVTQQRRPCRRRAAMRHTQGRKTPCAVRVMQQCGIHKAGKSRAPSESRSNAAHARPENAVRRHAARHTASRSAAYSLTQHGIQPHAVRHTQGRKKPRAVTQHGIQPHAARHTASRSAAHTGPEKAACSIRIFVITA